MDIKVIYKSKVSIPELRDKVQLGPKELAKYL